MNLALMKTELTRDEGFRSMPYLCTAGKLTTGVGRNLDGNPLTPDEIKVVGHDGRTKAISRGAAMYLLDRDIKNVVSDLTRAFPWFKELDDTRQRALVNMGFNLGTHRLLGFRQMLQAMREGRFEDAARKALDSRWAVQVGDRALRVARMIREGGPV